MESQRIEEPFLKRLQVFQKIKYQKNESQKKLFKAKDNLTRLRDIIIQNENRYGFLKRTIY